MQRFTELYHSLITTERVEIQRAAWQSYLTSSAKEDISWAMQLLCGPIWQPVVNTATLRQWATQRLNLSNWIIDETVKEIRDPLKFISLIFSEPETVCHLPLHQFIETRVLPLRALSASEREKLICETWYELSGEQRLLYNQWLTRKFRCPLNTKVLLEGFSDYSGCSLPEAAFRQFTSLRTPSIDPLIWLHASPLSDTFAEIRFPSTFCLATQHRDRAEVQSLGPCHDWLCEWSWQGERMQLVCLQDQNLFWSARSGWTDALPVAFKNSAQYLPVGTVLDGMLVHKLPDYSNSSVNADRGMKGIQSKHKKHHPLFVAHDLLAYDGHDWRDVALSSRRAKLQSLLQRHEHLSNALVLSPEWQLCDWHSVDEYLQLARERGLNGIILKNKHSAYHANQCVNPWREFRPPLYSIKGILTHARWQGRPDQMTHLLLTISVRIQNGWCPVAHVPVDLPSPAQHQIKRLIQSNTIERFGPLRVLNPELIFELTFADVLPSRRHKAAVVLKKPQIKQWLAQASLDEVDHLATVQSLLKPNHKLAQACFPRPQQRGLFDDM